MKKPPSGWMTTVKVDRVVDGDTLYCSITKRFKVRIVNEDRTFDTPETWRPKDEEERAWGDAATAFLKKLLYKSIWLKGYGNQKVVSSEQKEISIFIPSDKNGEMANIFTIGGRVQGMIFVDDLDEDVTVYMEEAGYNKDTK